MKKNYLIFLLTFISFQTFSQTWSLVWKDEFDSTALNTKIWSPAVGNGCDIGLCGWGNQEKEYYRNENISVANGVMQITAKKETFQTENYTSGRISSSGKASWKYGKMVARIKMSTGQGLWHAFWMLPQDLVYGAWPLSGEIDIMEYFGQYPNMVQSTIHFGDPWPNNKYAYNQKTGPDYSTDFHLYTLIWEENHIAFYVDSILIGEHTPASIAPKNWPFDQRFYFIINTAVGGNLTNNSINDAILPGYMQVDYLRVYAMHTEFDTARIAGPAALCNKDSSYLFSTGKAQRNWSYLWSVPPGATVVGLQGKDSVKVNFRNAVSGNVSLKITNDSSHTFTLIKHPVLASSCDTIRRPYGPMAVIPGRIEMENFDNGGPSRSYSDLDTANQGKAYRMEGVDIQTTTDAGGGYNIGWTEAREWLNYTVQIKKTAAYDIFVRAASTANLNTVSLQFDGKTKADSISIKNTGDYQSFYNNKKAAVLLDSGIHVMRLKMNNGGININYIDVLPANLANVNNTADNTGLLMYPNPVLSAFSIVLKTNTTATILISTLLGTTLLTRDRYNSEEPIDLSFAPAGIYFVTIKTSQGTTVQKIIKAQ